MLRRLPRPGRARVFSPNLENRVAIVLPGGGVVAYVDLDALREGGGDTVGAFAAAVREAVLIVAPKVARQGENARGATRRFCGTFDARWNHFFCESICSYFHNSD